MGKRRDCKAYPIDQSPLYKLHNKRKLAALFDLPLIELQQLISRTDNYRVFVVNKNSSRPRTVETPKPHMERLHRRLFNLLSRIEPPDYLHSGVKGRSYLTNAAQHVESETLVKLDIVKFFPSTKRWHVFDFFSNVMRCSEDVAGLLANLCTVDDHLPTGSCLSQIMAFYSHYEMFNDIEAIARKADLKMTCYVDDIVISGAHATGKTLHAVRTRIRRRGLMSHRKKEHVYSKGQPKLVTGVILNNSQMKVPNNKHKIIYDQFRSIGTMEYLDEKKSAVESLLGKTVAASQVDPGFDRKVAELQALRKRLKKHSS